LYNYFRDPRVTNDMLPRQLMNMKTHELSYSLIDIATHH